MASTAILVDKDIEERQRKIRLVHKRREIDFLMNTTYYLEALDIVKHLIEVDEMLKSRETKQNAKKLDEEIKILKKMGIAIKRGKEEQFKEKKQKYVDFLLDNGFSLN